MTSQLGDNTLLSSLNILHVVPSIDNEASGPSYSVVRLCEALRELGLNVMLAAITDGDTVNSRTFVKTFRCHPGTKRMGVSHQMYRWMLDKAKAGSIHLIHNHSIWMMPNVYPGWVARKSGVPYVVSPRGTLSEWAFYHGSPVKRLFWPLVQRPSLEVTTCWHATSHSEFRDIRRMGFKQPVAVVPNAVDIPNVQPKRKTNEKTLLFLGRIHPKKALDQLLPAWQSLQNRFVHWRLRIVGPDDGGYLYKCQAMARDLKLERVNFEGPLFGESKWKAYAESDLFVLPTYSENFGMVVAEALACGTPAVVTRGAPWEALEKNGCGKWIEIGKDSLIRALEEMMSLDSRTLQEMGGRGRQWMQRDFSWQRAAQQMAQTYMWILGYGECPVCVVEDRERHRHPMFNISQSTI